MPVPKIFSGVASKSTLKTGRDGSPASGVTANYEKEASSKTLVTAAVVPTYPNTWQTLGPRLIKNYLRHRE